MKKTQVEKFLQELSDLCNKYGLELYDEDGGSTIVLRDCEKDNILKYETDWNYSFDGEKCKYYNIPVYTPIV